MTHTLSDADIFISWHNVLYRAFVFLLAAMPLLLLFIPRALAVGPVLCGFVFFIAFWFMQGRSPRPLRFTLWIAGTVIAFSWIGLFWAYDIDISLTRNLKMLPLLAAFVLLPACVAALPTQRIEQIFLLLPLVTIIGALLLIVDLSSGHALYSLIRADVDIGEIRGAQLNRSVVIMCVCTVIVIPYLWARRAQPKNLALLGILTIAITGACILTESQTAHLALLAGLGTAFCFPYKKRWAWRAAAALLCLYMISFPWLAQIAYAHTAEIINQSAYLGKGGAYGAHRLEIWDFIGRAVTEPVSWLGYGIEVSRSIVFDSQGVYYGGGRVLHPHNFVMQIWLEFGLIGILTACVGLCLFFETMRKTLSLSAQKLVLPVIIAMLATISTSYGIWQGWLLGFTAVLYAYGVAATRLPMAEAQTKSAAD